MVRDVRAREPAGPLGARCAASAGAAVDAVVEEGWKGAAAAERRTREPLPSPSPPDALLSPALSASVTSALLANSEAATAASASSSADRGPTGRLMPEMSSIAGISAANASTRF